MNPATMQLSPTTRYALCGMAYLASRQVGHYALLEEVASAEKMPRHFLAKIFQQLAQQGFLVSRRGPGGGYALAQPPEKFSLVEVLSALGQTPMAGFCFLENRKCNAEQPCCMHEAAVAAGDLLFKALQKLTVADLNKVRPATTEDSFHV